MEYSALLSVAETVATKVEYRQRLAVNRHSLNHVLYCKWLYIFSLINCPDTRKERSASCVALALPG